MLTVLTTPVAINIAASHDVQAEYRGSIFYNNNRPADWWYSDGKDWYFFQNGKKLTGYGKDNTGTHYFYNGKYANWWYNDGQAWYFFQNGKKLTGYGKDSAGTHYFVNGKYANGKIGNKDYKDGKEVSVENKVPTRGYANGVYYVDSKPANWWYDDGQAWYFFQNGKKFTGYGKDNAGVRYFANGKAANWWYDDGQAWYFFQNGKKLTGYGKDNAGVRYFANGKAANWWYDDGRAWYFFQNGKKLTGYGKDNAGTHYFVNGKYANWWYSDGKDWYFFQNGKKFTGYGKDNAGAHYFANGKAANWWYDDGTDWYFFQNGKKLTGYGKDNAGVRYYANGKAANWWYDDGTDWYFFQNGKKLTGYGKDNAGVRYYANGKAANWWYDDGTGWYFFQNGKKFTGYGKDSAGAHYFANGKYVNENKGSSNTIYSGYYKVTALYIPIYDANGRILSHVSRGTVLFRDNRATVNGRIPVQVAGLTGYVNSSQVSAVNSSTTFIPDYVSDGKYVYHRYSAYSSVMVAYHNPNMQVGKPYYSADGINFGTFKLDHPFQFSNLKSRSNYTAADINRLYSLMGASNGKLAGKGATFKAAEQKYGVNALYLVAHSALESAWGKSQIAKDKNNFFGIAAYDSTPYTSATKFDDVDSGILGAARWIDRNYLSNKGYPANGAYLGNKAGGMNVNYATAPYWGESIASIMFSANEKLGRKDR